MQGVFEIHGTTVGAFSVHKHSRTKYKSTIPYLKLLGQMCFRIQNFSVFIKVI